MTAAVVALRRCRPAFDRLRCAEPGCRFDDSYGALARAGRDKLRAALTRPAETGRVDCRCGRCRARTAAPLSDTEADLALRHVSDRQAALHHGGLLTLGGAGECPRCGVIGLRRSGWWRSVDHDRRPLRKLAQNRVNQREAQLSRPPRRSEAQPHWWCVSSLVDRLERDAPAGDLGEDVFGGGGPLSSAKRGQTSNAVGSEVLNCDV